MKKKLTKAAYERSTADKKLDKRLGIKEGSKKDQMMDKKMKVKMGAMSKTMKPTMDKGLDRNIGKTFKPKKVMSPSQAAKKARSGADMGKKGKNFSKIAAKAGQEYGSAAAGKRVAGAIFQKMRRKGAL